MGMDISSKLLYGMKYRDLYDNVGEDAQEQLDEDLDYGEIEYASPYYDADQDTWFVGYELVQDFDLNGVRIFLDSLEEAEKHFKNRFGVAGSVRACKHVC